MPSKARRVSAAPNLVKRWVWGAFLLAGVVVGALVFLTREKTSAPSTPPSPSPSQLQPEKQISDTEVFNQYAGSASCKECHRKEDENWRGSNHQLAERGMHLDLDRAAFEPARKIEAGWQTSAAAVSNEQCRLTMPGPSGTLQEFEMAGVIGVAPLRQYLTPGPGGRLQAIEIAYDPHANEWFDIYGEEDRRPGEWGHWSGRGMTWNSMCASCHNTRLRKNYQTTNDSYRTVMAERSIGCEACHGPMKAHVQWQKHHANQRDPTLVALSTNQVLETCGSCHSRRSELTGDFVPGQNYFDHHALVITDETDLYYPDGQVREENYEFASFLSSGMGRAGVRCVDCHDPHSAKTILPGNQLCLRCHNGSFPGSPLINPVAHSFHKVGSAGAECVNCHMPQTTYMQRHARRDHGFTIPDPLMTVRHGVPNACNRCHTDRPAAWAVEAVDKWYGPRMERPTRARVETVVDARQNDATARTPLLQMLREDKSHFWQAAAAGLLRPWATESAVENDLVAALAHAHPLVRDQALRALELSCALGMTNALRAVRALLNDPIRAVRVRAAWALRSEINTASPAGVDLLNFINLSSDQPGGLVQRSAFLRARGQDQKAADDLRRAVIWDPNSAPIRHELAVVLSVLNQPQAAIDQLQHACQLEPKQAEYRFKLGLAYNEIGRLDKATEALKEAVGLDPSHGRAWYNLGLAYNETSQIEQALDALRRAEALSPRDAIIPYARATILAKEGRAAEARQAVERALEINPNHPESRQALQLFGP